MNKILVIVTVMVIMLFPACSGGSSSDSGSSGNGGTPPSTVTRVSMVPNQTYTMSVGQSIVKESEPTEVILETDVNTGVTEATLTSGSASIVTEGN